MEWRELPLLKSTKFQLRYKSTGVSIVKFSVNDVDLQVISLPSTSGSWATIDAGTYEATENNAQTVRLTIVSGSPDINYFLRVVNTATSIKNISSDKNLNLNSLQIYPNPYQEGNLSIKITGFESHHSLQLKITNLTGQIVYQQTVENTKIVSLNLSGILKEAVYIVSVEDLNSKVFSKLIVK